MRNYKYQRECDTDITPCRYIHQILGEVQNETMYHIYAYGDISEPTSNSICQQSRYCTSGKGEHNNESRYNRITEYLVGI